MKLASLSPTLAVLVTAVSATLCPSLVQAEEKTFFSDDFSDVKGYTLTQVDGEDKYEGEQTRHTFVFMDEYVSGLTLVTREDVEVKGADEKPGVFAFEFKKVPGDCAYSGVVYQGRAGDGQKMMLPKGEGDMTKEHLKPLRLKFKYKAVNNVNAEDVGASFKFRMEADVTEAYENRLDFDTLTATDKWQTFDSTLDKGSNRFSFLYAVNSENPESYKLVWAQSDEISGYQNGDTLLIDDVVLSTVE